MEATKFTRIKVNLITSYIRKDPLLQLDINEYSTDIKSVNGIYLKKEELKTEKIGNNLYLKTLDYTVAKEYTNLVAFIPQLTFYINYLLVRFDLDGGYGNLTNITFLLKQKDIQLLILL